MTPTRKPAARPRQCGAIAVETALMLVLLTTFLALSSVTLAIYFYQYSAAQKAVHDAALYMATAPRLEMTTSGPDGSPAALVLARKIIANEMAGRVPYGATLAPDILCSYRQGSGAINQKSCTVANNQQAAQTLVQINVSLDLPFIDPFTGSDLGWVIKAYAPVRYLGN